MSAKDAKKRAAAPTKPAAFPGGRAAPEAGELRIAVDRVPYAEIIGHAILEPDVEVCGVLVGVVGEDEHGSFVHVRHAIRGQAARQEGAAVTFTHETWNHIHQEMDRAHPDEQIVGWYHTHGGFGVFLSEMDTFVHQNFFPEPHHVAYVYDPLAGSEGFFVRRGEKLEPAARYWLGNRERRPAMRQPEAEPRTAAPAGGGGAVVEEIRKLTAAVQWSGREPAAGEGSWLSYVPWAIAIVCAALLFLGPRGGVPPEPRSGRLVVDYDGQALRTVTVPLLRVEELGADAWVLPIDLDLPAEGRVALRLPSGVVPLQKRALALRAEAERLAAERADAQGLFQRWALIGAAVLAALGAAAGAGWYFLLRRS